MYEKTLSERVSKSRERRTDELIRTERIRLRGRIGPGYRGRESYRTSISETLLNAASQKAVDLEPRWCLDSLNWLRILEEHYGEITTKHGSRHSLVGRLRVMPGFATPEAVYHHIVDYRVGVYLLTQYILLGFKISAGVTNLECFCGRLPSLDFGCVS